MIQMYPLNPVVSNDSMFAAAYNESDASIFMGSQCISKESAVSLMEQGAKFDFIVCLDDVDTLIQADANQDALAAESQPNVAKYSLSSTKSYSEVIEDLHGIIRGNLFEEGMG